MDQFALGNGVQLHPKWYSGHHLYLPTGLRTAIDANYEVLPQSLSLESVEDSTRHIYGCWLATVVHYQLYHVVRSACAVLKTTFLYFSSLAN